MNRPTAIRVVAGLIGRRDRVLACQRRADASFPLKWEFPGGKLEDGEGEIEALRRELKEELAIEIGAATEVFRSGHRYGNGLEVALVFFRVERFWGKIVNRAFHRLRWVPLPELGSLDFLEADLPLVEKLIHGRLRL